MKHDEFQIGREFRSGGRLWRCTDKGTRVIVAIALDGLRVANLEADRTLAETELDRPSAEAAGWFNGPPYAVAETVFDEDDMEGCTLS